MKAKLKKYIDGDYTLTLNNPKEYQYPLPYLSKQNCDKIFGVVDEDKKNLYYYKQVMNPYSTGEQSYTAYEKGFIEGFNKAMELNKDKRFTSRDMLSAYIQGTNDGAQFESLLDYDSEDFDEAHEFAKEAEREFIQSLQQPTEIEVEVEMERVVIETKVVGAVKGVKGSGHKTTTYKSVPKLDEDGCLILKSIKQ
jgi:hypothetical protein